ncbi:MAG TPA: PAS domain-containing sensor histidine kinase [Candidatus Obscuribacterales bacterium]
MSITLNIRPSKLSQIAVTLPSVIVAAVLIVSALAVYLRADLDVARLRTFLLAALGLCFLATLGGVFLVRRLMLSQINSLALTIAEQRERALVDYALDVVCSLSPDGIFVAVSPAALRCWGYLPENLLGKSITQFVHPDDKQSTLDHIKQTADKSLVETRIVRPDGRMVDTQWNITRSKSDAVLFCITSDVTERKQLEAAKRQFIALITHELRTPLSSFLFTLQLLLKGHYGKLTDDGHKHIEATESDVDRLIGLINELLDLEKMDVREFAVKLEPVVLSAVLAKSVNSVIGLAQKSGVKIEVQQAETRVLGDEDRLVQVVSNLLGNAIKFSPPGGEIKVEVHAAGSRVEVRVCDQGPGISRDEQSLVFERFKSFGKTNGASTGLGLAICKGLIEAHGGDIGVESEPGQGSVFWFSVKQI